MAIGIDGKEKPVFEEGQIVKFRLDEEVHGYGAIRGRVSENVIDMWIVEVKTHEGIDKATYPWSCIVVPHTLLEVLKDTPENQLMTAMFNGEDTTRRSRW